MRTDLMINFPNKDDISTFEINILFFTDDGFIYTARTKQFAELFKADRVQAYTQDWETWAFVSKERLQELKEIRKKMNKIE